MKLQLAPSEIALITTALEARGDVDDHILLTKIRNQLAKDQGHEVRFGPRGMDEDL